MSVTPKSVILAGIDGSDFSDAVIEYAIWLSKTNQSPLKLLHTIEHSHHSEQVHHEGNLTPNIKEHLLDELSDEERQESKQLIADGKRLITDAKQKAEQAGVENVIAKQRHGTLPEALSDLESEISMVVLGAKGEDHEGSKAGLGTQLEQAIRAISKPVFIATTSFSEPQKLLFAYNGSPTSQKVLNLLKRNVFFDNQLEIHIVSVQKSMADATNLVEDARTELQAAGLNIVAKAMTGDPVKELTQYQQEKAIDITMMGAFSHSKLHGFIFGSFTTQMLLESTTQFLLIR